MNIIDEAVQVAASAWDRSYEDAMLDAFYQARGQEMQAKKEREGWTSKSCGTGKSGQHWMVRLMQRLTQVLTLMMR